MAKEFRVPFTIKEHIDRYHAEVQATKERNDPERRVLEIMADGHLWPEPDQNLVTEEQSWLKSHGETPTPTT